MSAEEPLPIAAAEPLAGYLAHRSEIDAAVRAVLESGWYVLGRQVEGFERAFAAYVGAGHGVGVGSGTDALELALRACGTGPGDLVFTVAHTAVATVAAIERTGATPVLVDVDPGTYTLEPGSLERALARSPAGRPRAVVPVHLYGQPADMPAILALARRHGLAVVEDCAQAHGAALEGRKAGAWGDAAAFSFYPTKNLGAVGDGGMVVTADAALAERVRLLRQYGWRERYVSEIPGFNSRLDELQAAILTVRLRHLDDENAARRRLAGVYAAALDAPQLRLPRVRPGAVHVYHQYVVALPARDEARAALARAGIGTQVHYPLPVHLQPAYRGRLPGADALPRTEQAAREVLSLPLYPQLGEDAVRRVAGELVRVLRGRGGAG